VAYLGFGKEGMVSAQSASL